MRRSETVSQHRPVVVFLHVQGPRVPVGIFGFSEFIDVIRIQVPWVPVANSGFSGCLLCLLQLMIEIQRNF